MKKSQISVCMATYNGEKYIIEQLDSIWKQTRQPDEVIICDDCSKDNTVKLIHQFISEHGLTDKWCVYCNEQNKGYPGNFYYAMSLCQGDIVFLADQDDIWEAQKIEKMSLALEADEDMLLLASAWSIIDKNGKIVTKTKNSKSDLEYTNVSVQQIFYKYEWPGMAMCYRNEFVKEVLRDVQHTKLAHDVALALSAAEMNGFKRMDECLQYHRNHDSNAAMEEHRVLKLLNKGRKVLEIKRYIVMLQEVLHCKELLQEESRAFVLRKLGIMQERLQNLEKGKMLRIIKQYLKNRDVIRASTVVCDCLICWQRYD